MSMRYYIWLTNIHNEVVRVNTEYIVYYYPVGAYTVVVTTNGDLQVQNNIEDLDLLLKG